MDRFRSEKRSIGGQRSIGMLKIENRRKEPRGKAL
jgi:hypothetical protein